MILVLVRMSWPLSGVEIVVVRMRVSVFASGAGDDLGGFDPLNSPALMKHGHRAHTRQRAQHHCESGQEPDSVQQGATREHD